MPKKWIDELTIDSYPEMMIQKEGLEIRSEIAMIRRRAMEQGPADYVTVWIRSSHPSLAVENTLSFEPKDTYTKEQFEEGLTQSRHWFAEQLAKDILGKSAPRPVYYFVSLWNPADPSKRVNALGGYDETIPHTLVMRELCDSLDLKDSKSGLKTVSIKVVSRTFVTDVQPAEMSIPVIVGRDLFEQARNAQPPETRTEELFLTETTKAVIAQRKAQDKTVLVIGSHSDQGLQRMRLIEALLLQKGYEPVLIKDFRSTPEPLETKFLSFAMISKFVVYEGSFPSGAIDEYRICKDNRIITAVLHEAGKLATSMQDYEREHNFIKAFSYTDRNVELALQRATAWAESVANQRRLEHQQKIDQEKYK